MTKPLTFTAPLKLCPACFGTVYYARNGECVTCRQAEIERSIVEKREQRAARLEGRRAGTEPCDPCPECGTTGRFIKSKACVRCTRAAAAVKAAELGRAYSTERLDTNRLFIHKGRRETIPERERRIMGGAKYEDVR